MSTTMIILKQIEALGFKVSVHINPGSLRRTVAPFVEMHAVKVPEGEPVHIARHLGGDGEREQYLAACELAGMVGIDLEDG